MLGSRLACNSEANKMHIKQHGVVRQIAHHPKRTQKTGSARSEWVVGSSVPLLYNSFSSWVCVVSESRKDLDSCGFDLAILAEEGCKTTAKLRRSNEQLSRKDVLSNQSENL